MADVTLSWYHERFHGRLGEDDFFHYLPKARAYVCQLTCGRSEDSSMDAVKAAICAVIEAMELGDRGAVASETNDGVSVTYSRSSDDLPVSSPQTAAAMHLAGTGLLYQGVYD